MNKLEIMERVRGKMDEMYDFDHPDRLIAERRRRAYERLQQTFNRLCGRQDDSLDAWIESQRAAKLAFYRGDQLFDLVGKPYWIGDDELHVLGLKPE